MRFEILPIFASLALALTSGLVRAQENESLTERVRRYSERYRESMQNMRCDVEGDVADSHFHGEIALLNGTAPFHMPPSGGFFSRKVTATGSGDEKSETTVIKLGNPQYSFRLVRQELDSPFQIDDLSIQYDNIQRTEISKDRVFFAFSATDSEAVFAPIMVHDVSTVDLLKGDRGVQRRIATTSNTKQADIEFFFPENHPFGHATASVSLGESGELLRYELRERSENGIDVCYLGTVRYSQSDYTPSGLPLPTELRVQTTTKVSGKTTPQSEYWYKLSNFQFGKNTIGQFTLSYYDMPEPEGAKVDGRVVPSTRQMAPPQFELPEFTLQLGNKADYSLNLRNPNSYPLRIVGIAGSCGLGGCVEPKEFHPCVMDAGASMSVAIALESKKLGPLETALTIYYGTESVRSVKVLFKGKVEN